MGARVPELRGAQGLAGGGGGGGGGGAPAPLAGRFSALFSLDRFGTSSDVWILPSFLPFFFFLTFPLPGLLPILAAAGGCRDQWGESWGVGAAGGRKRGSPAAWQSVVCPC